MRNDNRRIAVNTGILYVRMLLIMAITIYTSRILLKALGITDYGIYNVVGMGHRTKRFFSDWRK